MRKPALVASSLLLASTFAVWPAGSLAQTAPSPSATATVVPTETPLPTDVPTATAVPADVPDAPTPTPPPASTSVPAAAAPTPFVSNVPCASDDPSNERVRRSDRRGWDEDGSNDPNEFNTGNGRNQVVVHNCTDNRLRVRASIQLNTIPGHFVRPLNEAYAEGSCTGCQTFAIALQIDLYSASHAGDIEPQNYAVALNTGCTGCVTVARALQYVQPEDDPHDVSRDISDDVDALDEELSAIQRDPSIGLVEAEQRLNGVLTRFAELGGTLGDQRDEKDD